MRTSLFLFQARQERKRYFKTNYKVLVIQIKVENFHPLDTLRYTEFFTLYGAKALHKFFMLSGVYIIGGTRDRSMYCTWCSWRWGRYCALITCVNMTKKTLPWFCRANVYLSIILCLTEYWWHITYACYTVKPDCQHLMVCLQRFVPKAHPRETRQLTLPSW